MYVYTGNNQLTFYTLTTANNTFAREYRKHKGKSNIKIELF